MRKLVVAGAVALALAILAGHAGALHPALDSFSHVRLQLLGLAGVVAVVLLLARRWAPGLGLAVIAGASLALTLPYMRPAAVPGPAEEGMRDVLLLQQNLNYRNRDVAGFVARVAEIDPDVIALQEMRDANLAVLDRLAAEYPHRHRCRGVSSAGDVAILSRFPFDETPPRRCTPGLAVATLNVGGTALTLGSLHLHWPWPFDQPEHVDSIEPFVSDMAEPAVLVGDFNAVVWSATVGRIASFFGGDPTSGSGGTRRDPALPKVLQPLWDIPIDQAIVAGAQVVSFDATPLAGSDHDTMVTRVRIRVRNPENETVARLVNRASTNRTAR